jgi:hypothetical protein
MPRARERKSLPKRQGIENVGACKNYMRFTFVVIPSKDGGTRREIGTGKVAMVWAHRRNAGQCVRRHGAAFWWQNTSGRELTPGWRLDETAQGFGLDLGGHGAVGVWTGP